jgi:hypothetical protein
MRRSTRLFEGGDYFDVIMRVSSQDNILPYFNRRVLVVGAGGGSSALWFDENGAGGDRG